MGLDWIDILSNQYFSIVEKYREKYYYKFVFLITR